jgi:transcriptional regulator with XRE-family HTH domain
MTHPLKAWRTRQGLTQLQASAKLDADVMTVSRWERGEHLPHKRHWPKIKQVTGIAPSQLVDYVKPEEVNP